MRVLIDGELVSDAEATISVFDWGVVRGFGCFEVVRSYDGKAFRVEQHLDRMEQSAKALSIPLPDRSDLADWIRTQAATGGDCLVRSYTTAGSPDPLFSTPGRTVVMWEPLPAMPDTLRLAPRAAPWHAAGAPSELSTAKTLSYAPNMAATRAAEVEGFDEALLLSRDETVLEGPTFSVGWFDDGVLQIPSLDLMVLASITRQAAIEVAAALGIEVTETHARLDQVLEADEVFALSTVKQVAPVVAIGSREFDPGPMTAALAEGFSALVATELAAEEAPKRPQTS